jgi:hypothetical protein
MHVKHGHGGGMRVGGKFNKVEDLKFDSWSDIYCIGHTHQIGAFPSMVMELRGSRIVARKTVHVLGGSFLKTYVKGYSGYARKLGYHPTKTGVARIDIYPTKDPIDIHCRI